VLHLFSNGFNTEEDINIYDYVYNMRVHCIGDIELILIVNLISRLLACIIRFGIDIDFVP